MPFTEYVMTAGSWSLELDPGTPRAIRNAIDVRTAGFSELLILPAHVKPEDFGDAGMLAAARYGGIYRKQSASGLILEGAGMNVLLGDEDGKGNVIQSAVSTAGGTLTQWYSALTPTTEVTAGTCTDPGGTYNRSFVRVTHRQAWDVLCQRFGVEYRVKPNRVFDVGPRANLYGSTPKVILLGASSRVSAGRDVGLTGVAASIDRTIDLEDLTTQVLYLTGDRDAPTSTTSGGSHATLKNAAGYALFIERMIDATNDDDSGTPANMAAAQLGRFNNPRIDWNVEMATGYDIGRTAPIGSPVWLYDPANGLYDNANARQYRGAQVSPVESRLMGADTPITAAHGVYLRRATGTSSDPVYTDLTPYIVPESGVQRLAVGAIPRPSR